MTVRYTETALAELDDILTYLEDRDAKAAERVRQAVIRAIKRIEALPELSPVVFEGRVRAKLVVPFQYRLFYEIVGGDLIIRNIRSTRRLRPWEDLGPQGAQGPPR